MKIKLKHILLIVLSLVGIVIIVFVFTGKNNKKQVYPTPFLSVDAAWADTTIKYLSLKEKIGQLIIYDTGLINETNSDSLFSYLYKFMPGGIIFYTDSLS